MSDTIHHPGADGWLQLRITLPRGQTESVAALLEALGALSITYGDAADEPQLEPAPGATPLWPQVELTALFSHSPDNQRLLARIRDDLARENGLEAHVEPLAERVWERVWMDDFHPARFGRRLWICPRNQQPPADEATQSIVVTLDPGLAFGTGHHETTALCLEWLDGTELNGARVLDFGCGSGILAIAALKLGAAMAVGVDHDPQALEATHENALANGVRERLTICSPEELGTERFDCVLANILANPLIELASELTTRLRPAGALVLSGILKQQVEAVSAAYENAIDLAKPQLRNDWALLHGAARNDAR